jgi:hydroxyethylthiazole kinase-like uncharacterized protein yjeF
LIIVPEILEMSDNSPGIRITTQTARKLDSWAIEQLKVPSLLLMENAARNCADQIWHHYQPRSALIVCGTGNNGGDGLAIARHLLVRGSQPAVLLIGDETRMTPDARVNLEIARSLGIDIKTPGAADCHRTLEEICVQPQPVRPLVIVDAMLGTGATGPLREPYAAWCSTLNAIAGEHNIPLVAIDIPTGLEADTGQADVNTIQASLTITFIAEKVGFGNSRIRNYLGQVITVDIGVPNDLLLRRANPI